MTGEKMFWTAPGSFRQLLEGCTKKADMDLLLTSMRLITPAILKQLHAAFGGHLVTLGPGMGAVAQPRCVHAACNLEPTMSINYTLCSQAQWAACVHATALGAAEKRVADARAFVMELWEKRRNSTLAKGEGEGDEEGEGESESKGEGGSGSGGEGGSTSKSSSEGEDESADTSTSVGEGQGGTGDDWDEEEEREKVVRRLLAYEFADSEEAEFRGYSNLFNKGWANWIEARIRDDSILFGYGNAEEMRAAHERLELVKGLLEDESRPLGTLLCIGADTAWARRQLTVVKNALRVSRKRKA